ncbi:hypothetical protein EAH89_25650 [Roseomonas nepalensis]|uniref:Uncharacterized protein n=1 Tax=Muricoccus nepalensis TaxID=1854500 RepID=A0A502F9K7_9PROT|nr:hypothetical protein EAH89_25650 [Roseomonas nepalensis]
MVRRGRGRLGGTTALDASIQLALAAGRNPIIADSARNPTLSSLYGAAATKPASDSITDVNEWLMRDVLNTAVEERRPVALDMGGGQDQTLDDFTQHLDLVAFCKDAQLDPVALYPLGPDMDDFEHALKLRDAGYFSPEKVLLVMNEGVLRRGEDPHGAFGQIRQHPEFLSWVKAGAKPIYMRSLAALPDIRKLGLSLNEAAKDQPAPDGRKLGYAKAWMTRAWLRDFEAGIAEAGAVDWLL